MISCLCIQEIQDFMGGLPPGNEKKYSDKVRLIQMRALEALRGPCTKGLIPCITA
jgi:hypothetical protein